MTAKQFYRCIFIILIIIVSSVNPAVSEKRSVLKKMMPAGQEKERDNRYVECLGVLRFKNKISVRLGNGETVTDCFVKNGMAVKKGTPLVRIGNYNLMDRYAGLQEKLLGLKQKAYQAQLVEIKIDEEHKKIQRIQKRIGEEQAIKNKISSYKIEERVNVWLEEINEKSSHIRIFEKELEILKKQIKENTSLIQQVEKQLKSTKKRLDNLFVKAPFAGKITGIPLNYKNAFPGSLILELYDADSLEIEAKAWQHHLQYIESGAEVKIFPDQNQDRFLGGIVRSIGIEGILLKEGGSPFFPVIIDLKTSLKEMRPGMVVMTKILKTKQNKQDSQ